MAKSHRLGVAKTINTIFMSSDNPLKSINIVLLITTFYVVTSISSCRRQHEQGGANVLAPDPTVTTPAVTQPRPRLPSTDTPSGSQIDLTNFGLRIYNGYEEAYRFFMDLKTQSKLSEQEIAEAASTLMVAIDADGVKVSAEQAMKLYHLLENNRKADLAGLVISLIFEAYGLDESVDFYKEMEPGEARMRMISMLTRHIANSEHSKKLLSFIDGLEYVEERRAAARTLNAVVVIDETGGCYLEAERLLASVRSLELREAILEIFLRHADPTGRGGELAVWMADFDPGGARQIIDIGWQQFFNRDDLPVSDILDLLQYPSGNDDSRRNAFSNIGRSLNNRQPDDIHQLFAGLEREEQIMLARSIQSQSDTSRALDLASKFPDDELRDAYLAGCARTHAFKTRALDLNPYLTAISSDVFRQKVSEDLEKYLQLLDDEEH
jgi:hypothetical protein